MQDMAAYLTLEEQIGQIFMIGFAGPTITPALSALLSQQHVGNLILFSRNVQDASQVQTLTASLQRLARESGQPYPLLIAIDQENGAVQRLGPHATAFPGNMALGATRDEQSTCAVACATGLELKALGINLNLAPVVDVNNNPANPVIGTRSFGSDPLAVARLASAALKGYQEAGIACCIKHFPGHGDTTRDSHLVLPTIPHSLERLNRVELIPFKQCIADQATMVMTAHLAFPALTGAPQLPATLSPTIVHQLLRTQLGYQGVIITDCLEMRAIAATSGVARGAVLALKAGHNLLLVSHSLDLQHAAIDAVKAAVHTGELTPTDIQQAATRVLQLKERLQTRNAGSVPPPIDYPAHQHLSQSTYEQAITLIRDHAHLLPLHLKPTQRLLLVSTQRDRGPLVVDREQPADELLASIRLRHANTEALKRLTTTGDEELVAQASAADVVVMLTANALRDPFQVQTMHTLLRMGRPLIGLAIDSPYDLVAFPTLATCLVTYDSTSPALATAARVLFGEIAARGHLPVDLPPGV